MLTSPFQLQIHRVARKTLESSVTVYRKVTASSVHLLNLHKATVCRTFFIHIYARCTGGHDEGQGNMNILQHLQSDHRSDASIKLFLNLSIQFYLYKAHITNTCDCPKPKYKTSLSCRWQTRATQCFAPTVLYTDVDGQCDKLTPAPLKLRPYGAIQMCILLLLLLLLVTDDGHQFTTLTVHLSWQHLRRSAVPEIWLVPNKF